MSRLSKLLPSDPREGLLQENVTQIRFRLGGDLSALFCVANLRLSLYGNQKMMLPASLSLVSCDRPPHAAEQLLLRRRIVGNKERGKLQRVVDKYHIHTMD